MKILVVCRSLTEPCDGGRVVTKRNISILKSYFKDIYIVETPRIGVLQRLANILLLRPYNYSKAVKEDITTIIDECDWVFLDGSLYGNFAKIAKKKGKKVCTFYHNIEYLYYKQMINLDKVKMKSLYLFYIWYNERLSTKYSNKIITISSRDGVALETIYKRKSDAVIPTSFNKIELQNSYLDLYKPEINQLYCLFVGSDFYANREGVLWFIKNVLPNIKMTLVVAGSICNSLEQYRGKYSNLVLKGFVDNLDELYFKSSCVISPIFSGSGLKTKTIEAMRYGKFILGTSEAFVGVEKHISEVGVLCDTKEDYISGLEHILSIYEKDSTSQTTFFKSSYDCFIKNYAHDVAYAKFAQVFKSNE